MEKMSTTLAATAKLKNSLLNLHTHCIGLHVNDVTPKVYFKLVIRHLLQISRSNAAHPKQRRRAQFLLVTLFVSGATLLSGVTYGAFRFILKCYKFYKYPWKRKNRTLIRRTRSQMQLDSGARIMYIPEVELLDRQSSDDNKFMNAVDKKKRKRIFIPPKDDDIYEHDKFLFKNVELKRARNSQLFYSKFLNQMNVLSRILIPTVYDKNSLLLTAQIFFLIMRTWLSLFVAKLDGQIVKNIIAGRGKSFLWDLGCWFLIAVPASYTNSAIKVLQRKLSLNFRVNLTRYIHDMYLDKRLTFYKLIFDAKASNSVIKNIDNSITNDVSKFCDATCSVFANIAKPVIDLIFFSIYLRDNLGTVGVAGIFVNYFITGFILRRYTPPLGKLASERSASDGDYYNYHLNMINNSEEIAFYQGTAVERTKVKELYDVLMEKMLLVDKCKFGYNMLEDYVLKYTWSGLGYVFASIPIVVSTLATGINSEEKNMKEFIVNKRLMLSLADAGSRLMHSIKDISQLTGYTNRIFTLLSVLHRVHSLNFNYGAVPSILPLSTEDASKNPNLLPNTDNSQDAIRGTIQNNFNGIRLENIDVIIPSVRASEGIKLINKLTFQIPLHIDPITSKSNSIQDLSKANDIKLPFLQGSGSSLLILGPNGCGKSSIQRIIAEIWPVYNKNGLLSIPSENNIFFIPQKPYFSRGGTLRDQIIYPMSPDEFFDRGFKDKELVQILVEVKLDYLLKRAVGLTYLDVVADWKDLLSGGEKQRVNFARIMFHKPLYVVLDEATNAISVDMEDYLFNLLKRYKFNFISISQRPTLIKYHEMLLEIGENRDGKWQLQAVGTDEAITSIDNEIEELEKKLEKVKDWEDEREKLQRKLEII